MQAFSLATMSCPRAQTQGRRDAALNLGEVLPWGCNGVSEGKAVERI